jgi:hypothetical protein
MLISGTSPVFSPRRKRNLSSDSLLQPLKCLCLTNYYSLWLAYHASPLLLRHLLQASGHPKGFLVHSRLLEEIKELNIIRYPTEIIYYTQMSNA